MLALIHQFLDWIRGLFWRQEMEISLVGLQYAGKSTLINVMASGTFREDMIPTVGFNMRKVSKGGVTIKIWDIGGQPRFRPMWERYCRGVNAILFMVDAADTANMAEAKAELNHLLMTPQLDNIPILVLGNKNDLPGALDTSALIDQLGLGDHESRSISCYTISCKEKFNIGITFDWLLQHKTRPGTS